MQHLTTKKIREWIPVVYYGTVRIVGYFDCEEESNFIMSEPILHRLSSHLLLSPSFNYELIDNFLLSEMTILKYYSCTHSQLTIFKRTLLNFVNGFPITWKIDMFNFNFMLQSDDVLLYHYPKLYSNANEILLEIYDNPAPTFSYKPEEVEFKIITFIAEASKDICKYGNKSTWKTIIRKMLNELNIEKDLSKILSISFDDSYLRNKIPSILNSNYMYNLSSINVKNLYLWYIYITDNGNIKLTGWIFGTLFDTENGVNRSFNQVTVEILYFTSKGQTLFVKDLDDIKSRTTWITLIGPLCPMLMFIGTKDHVIDGWLYIKDIIERIGYSVFLMFISGLPKYWQEYTLLLRVIQILATVIASRYGDENDEEIDITAVNSFDKQL